MWQSEWTQVDVDFHAKKICANLKLAVERRSISIEKLSELSGIDSDTLRKVYDGDHQTKLETIIRILLALRMSEPLKAILDPSEDEIGVFYEFRQRPPVDYDF
jgi:lambda repressor-like predicted transcriptional regulator